MKKLLWVLEHPSQYHAPLFRKLAAEKDIRLTVLYLNTNTSTPYVDKEFGRIIEWSTNLLEGYKSLSVNNLSTTMVASALNYLRLNIFQKSDIKYDAVVISGWNSLFYFASLILAKLLGMRILMRCEATNHFTNSKGIKRKLRSYYLKYFLRQVDVYLSIGKHNYDFYECHKTDAQQIISSPYCVDNELFSSAHDMQTFQLIRKRLGLNEHVPILLYASKLIPRKNPLLLLRGYEQLLDPKPYLLFIGDGILRDAIAKYVLDNGLSRVRILGFVNQDMLPWYYNMADIFVLISREETWGLVVNEAMCSGCAILGSEGVGCVPDLILHKENGYVISEYTPESVASAITFLVSQHRYRGYGTKSQQIVSRYSIEAAVNGVRHALSCHDKDSNL